MKQNISQWGLLFSVPFIKFLLGSHSVSGSVYTDGRVFSVEAICPPEWARSTFGQSVVPSVTCTDKVILEQTSCHTVVRLLRTAHTVMVICVFNRTQMAKEIRKERKHPTSHWKYWRRMMRISVPWRTHLRRSVKNIVLSSNNQIKFKSKHRLFDHHLQRTTE